MKHIAIILPLFIFSISAFAVPISIPNASFEAFLVNEGFDSDGLVNGQMADTDVLSMTNLNCTNDLSITGNVDLKEFSNLEAINIRGSGIGSIDITGLISLVHLDIGGPNIITVDLSTNTSLEFLGLWEGIEYIDLSQNLNLINFYASFTELKFLDLSNNINITWCQITNNSQLGRIKLHTDVGSYSSSVGIFNNPALFCIEVNDMILALNNFNSLIWLISGTHSLPNPSNPFSLSCPSTPSTTALVLKPNLLELPRQSNTEITALTSTKPGSLVWSTDDNCVKVYNGTSWNCL
ncbi:MAG: hypothetical protein NXI00_06745 [Cytophagales bacterium]|nr:hypothetical protein [Cytophagales bacterium]